MDKRIPLLTIVTPTYNRAHLLSGCYESLQRQTDKSFEWIIVDDGSEDNTESVVSAFDASFFPITYIRKENGGKHTALNTSHPYIRGEYVLILDSDDTLINTAVADVLFHWNRYGDQEEIGVITFLRKTPAGELFATVKDFDTPVDITVYPRTVYLGNDCCEVIRTELFTKYPFPVFEGEKFLSEGVLWSRVARTHQCVYINKAIYLSEYLTDGLTKAGRAMRICNPRGGMLSASFGLDKKNPLKSRVKNGLLYICYGFFAGLSVYQILSMDSGNGWLKTVCLTPGYVLYRFWKNRHMK